MTGFRLFFSKLLNRDRRREDRPVDVERRQSARRLSISEAQERLLRSMNDFEETVVRAKKKPGSTERAMNDTQQVVLFPSLQQVCRFRGPDALKVRLCRRERHQDAANSTLAICEESKCPIILEAISGRGTA